LYFTELSYIVNGEVEFSNYNNYDQQNRCKVYEEKTMTNFLDLRQGMKHEDGEN
jgi:hypothetical protein